MGKKELTTKVDLISQDQSTISLKVIDPQLWIKSARYSETILTVQLDDTVWHLNRIQSYFATLQIAVNHVSTRSKEFQDSTVSNFGITVIVGDEETIFGDWRDSIRSADDLVMVSVKVGHTV